MGRITDEMTRLVGEIQGGHRDRQQMIQDLRRNGAEMQAGFHAAHAEMSRRQKKALRDFVTGMEDKVCGLLDGFAGDLAGARRAWGGTSSLELTSRCTGAANLERSVPEAEAAETKPVVGTRAVAGGSAKGVKGTRSAGRRWKKLHT